MSRRLAVPAILSAAGGGGAGLTFKGSLLFEGTGASGVNDLDFSSLNPEEGDLVVIIAEGAGGISNHFQPTDAGWNQSSFITSSGRTMWKYLADGETTGPSGWTSVSADWHLWIAVWSGARMGQNLHTDYQQNGFPLLGSNVNQRVFKNVLVPEGSHGFFVAGGSSGTAEWTATPTFSWTPVEGSAKWDGREVTFGHATAGAVVEGNGVATDYTIGNLGVDFNFNTSTAFRGAYVVVHPEPLPASAALPESLGSTTMRNFYDANLPLVAGAQVGDVAIIGTTVYEDISWSNAEMLGMLNASSLRLYLHSVVLDEQMISDGYLTVDGVEPGLYTVNAWFFRGVETLITESMGIFDNIPYPVAPNSPGFATFPAVEIPDNYHAVYVMAVSEDLGLIPWQNVTETEFTQTNFSSDCSTGSALYTPTDGVGEVKSDVQVRSTKGTGEIHVVGIVLVGG